MISYLLPALGGVAGIGFTSVTVASYVSENYRERLEWLDAGLSGIKDKENFKYGIAVKIENPNGTLDCDEEWKKKTNDDRDTNSCRKTDESFVEIKQLFNGDLPNKRWNEISSEIQDLEHDHKYCNIFTWNPTLISGDIGMKEIVRVVLEWHCFKSENVLKAHKFSNFFRNVVMSKIDTEQEDRLIGGIVAGFLEGDFSNWIEIIPTVTSHTQEWDIVVNGILKGAEDRSRFKFQSKLEEDKGWSSVKLRKS